MEKTKVNALAQLAELDLEARRIQYPNAPLHAITSRRFNDRSTNALTLAVLRWLELHGHYAVRVSTTGRRSPDKVVVDVLGRQRTFRGHWIKGSTRRGTADVHAVIAGRHCSIEIKCEATNDRMSEAQQRTMADVRKSGGEYFVCQNFTQFLTWYHNLITP